MGRRREGPGGESPARGGGVWGLLPLFVAGYVATLVCLFPADQAWQLARDRLGEDRLPRAAAIEGTVWKGEARGLVIEGETLDRVSWGWRPQAVLRGRLGFALEVESEAAYLQAQAWIGPGTVELVNLRGRTDLERWNGRVDFPGLLGGMVEIEDGRVEFDHALTLLDLSGQVHWRGAAMGFPQVSPLGDYAADLAARDGSVWARVTSSTDAGLGVEGEIVWVPSGIVRVDLELEPRNGLAPALRSAVESLARPEAGGRLRMRFEQRMAL